MTTRMAKFFDAVILDLMRQMRWSFLPPLMVYFAAGASGITLIVGTFFVKDYLDLTAAAIAGIAFWAGIPWALKMPLGHLVDLIWRWKAVMVWFGAAMIALSLVIMIMALTQRAMMEEILPLKAWYILSYLLTPCGLVLQDVVADAMSIEAVPRHDEAGRELSEADVKSMHVTMQMLGRVALILGTLVVAAMNIVMFSGAASLDLAAKGALYAQIYTLALFIPVVSLSGVIIGAWQKSRRGRQFMKTGFTKEQALAKLSPQSEPPVMNLWYFIGGGAFVALSLIVGLGQIPYGQEIIFLGSMAVVLFLMRQLVALLSPAQARMLIGTALAVFFFRVIPLPGEGLNWFNIDVLGFDEQFLSVLSLITAVMTLIVMLALRPMMAKKRITWIILVLSIAAGILALPNIGLYYGVHNWTAGVTGGIVDARFIAVLDTAAETPLAQIAMVPMLAWIARNAPSNMKATFFAVMASFTNLALSASNLVTKYLNQIFIITREVKDSNTGAIQVAADYSQLGMLLLVVLAITVLVPLVVVFAVQRSPLRTSD